MPFTGGALTRHIRTDGVSIDIANTVTQASTLRVVRDNNVLLGNASPVVTLWLEGTTDFGFSRLYVDQDASNFGILKLECTSNDGNNQNSYLEMRNNARLTNETTGIIESNAGAGDSRILTGTLVNKGHINATTATTFQGLLEAAGGFYSDLFFVTGSQVTVTGSPATPATIRIVGDNNQLIMLVPRSSISGYWRTNRPGSQRRRASVPNLRRTIRTIPPYGAPCKAQ